jgi:hypothetical protein
MEDREHIASPSPGKKNIIYFSSRRRIKHRTIALEAIEKPNNKKLNAATMTTPTLRL